jgi:hypothetical protein
MGCPSKKRWTFMVYNNYDDPSIGVMHGDIAAQLQEVGSTDEVDLVILCDDRPAEYGGQEGFGSPLFHIPAKRDPLATLVNHPDWDDSEKDLGDPGVLVAFVAFCQQHFPAERYVLVIAGHGYGWLPAAYPSARDNYTETLRGLLQDFHQRKGAGTPTPPRQAPAPEMLERVPVPELTLAPDMTSQDEMSCLDIEAAAAQIAEALGQALDVMAFDACFMQMAEIAFQVGSNARYQVGPQWYGLPWNYTALCQALVDDPGMEAATLAQTVVSAYADNQLYTPRYTMSAIDLQQLETLQRLTTDAVQAFEAASPDTGSVNAALAATTTVDDSYNYRDMGDLAQQIATLPSSRALRQAAESLRSGIVDKLVLAHCSRGFDGATGLSVTAPLPADLSDQDIGNYMALNFSQLTSWGDLLTGGGA